MRDVGEIEKLLAETAAPNVVEGVHRATLKGDLLQHTRTEDRTMFTRKRLLVAGCVALGLAAAGWAAQKAVRTFIVEESSRIVEEIVNPDGSVTVKSVAGAVAVGSDDPDFTQEKADAMWVEMKEAIAAGNYVLVETKETDQGEPIYVYKLTLADGTTVGYACHSPLPDPAEN